MQNLKRISRFFLITGLLAMSGSILAKNMFQLSPNIAKIILYVSYASMTLGTILNLFFYIKTKDLKSLKETGWFFFVFSALFLLFYFVL